MADRHATRGPPVVGQLAPARLVLVHCTMRPWVIAAVASLLASGVASAAPPARAQVYVAIASSHDDSPDATDDAMRHDNVATIRHALTAALDHTPTLSRRDADATWLDERHIDVSLAKLHVETVHGAVELSAELRIVISDASGKLLSQVASSAKLDAPRRAVKAGKLAALRKQVLEEATAGIVKPLCAHLLRSTTPHDGAAPNGWARNVYASAR